MATASLQPAQDLARQVSKPYPNDSTAYREARTALLAEEIELRRHIGGTIGILNSNIEQGGGVAARTHPTETL